MKRLKYYMVDVFAEQRFGGNQLAVFTESHTLTTEDMQNIAREINFSETVFIGASYPERLEYEIRIFTPQSELPFAGHPTLGAAYVIREELLKGERIERLTLSPPAGAIPVTFDDATGVITMRQLPPTFGKMVERERLLPVLGLEADDFDESFPLEEVSTGLPTLIVPLKSLEAVKRCKIKEEPFYELLGSLEAEVIFVFSRESYSSANGLNGRLFASDLQIVEDPATGSANGCLAAYLLKHSYLGEGPVECRVEQGYEIGRPSLLIIEADELEGEYRIMVGGRVISMAEGHFFI